MIKDAKERGLKINLGGSVTCEGCFASFPLDMYLRGEVYHNKDCPIKNLKEKMNCYMIATIFRNNKKVVFCPYNYKQEPSLKRCMKCKYYIRNDGDKVYCKINKERKMKRMRLWDIIWCRAQEGSFELCNNSDICINGDLCRRI